MADPVFSFYPDLLSLRQRPAQCKPGLAQNGDFEPLSLLAKSNQALTMFRQCAPVSGFSNFLQGLECRA
ncbi:hypothetical protein [uncultured Roseibium sp.]|uniref:hypothetical protein n=1 Tax=uncultured Roseibium sp. TaxID=1936171 RepID=UPI003217BFD8